MLLHETTKRIIRTAALVPDGAARQVAALGDGDDRVQVDAGVLHDVGEEQRAEALGAVPAPDVPHRGAAAGRRRGLRVLHRRRARRELQRQVVGPRRSALVATTGAGAVRAARRDDKDCGAGKDQSEDEEGPHCCHCRLDVFNLDPRGAS